jgi:hypothetical protein
VPIPAREKLPSGDMQTMGKGPKTHKAREANGGFARQKKEDESQAEID